MKSNCPLCGGESHTFLENVFSCNTCFLLFKARELHLTSEEENKRYQYHQNKNSDQGYIDFLNRLAIPLQQFITKDFRLLDFGCGPYSELSKMLTNHVKSTSQYDPLFFPDEEVLREKFEVVTCTEVVEHFKNPAESWEKLVQCVQSKGILAIMTQFYNDEINYSEWWYKNDPTHVGFYREETFLYLIKKYKMKILYNDHRSVIIFQYE